MRDFILSPQNLNKLLPSFPTEINNYHEIFVGGGSVLKTNPNMSIKYTTKNSTIIDECTVSIVDNRKGKTSKEVITTGFEINTIRIMILASSQFIFLNKTCFRAL
jgi:site-specific DNA-adenine methylase